MLIVADPFAFPCGVNVSVPFAATVGCAAKRALFVFVTTKFSACPLSFAAPALMDVAHPLIVAGPAAPHAVLSAPPSQRGPPVPRPRAAPPGAPAGAPPPSLVVC